MKYLWIISTAITFLAGCKKDTTNSDALITLTSYYGINKTTRDTIFTFHIPSGFTPNGDNINEYWEPKSYGLDSSHYRIDIFNKSGKIIFKSDTPAKFYGVGKGGILLPQQTLCFFIETKDKSGEDHTFKGQFVLVR